MGDQAAEMTPFTLLKRHYENWFGIMVGYLKDLLILKIYHKDWITLNAEYSSKHPRKARLRGGQELTGKEINIANLLALASLLEEGWMIYDRNQLSKEGTSFRFSLHTSPGNLSEKPIDWKDKVVLDVGMYDGETSIAMAKKGASLIIGLEPATKSFEDAKRNIQNNGLGGKILPLNLALSSSEGEAPLLISSSLPESNSLLQMQFDSTVMVNTTTLNALIRRFGLERIDILKLNCEGSEYEILENAPFEHIQEITMHYHQGLKNIPRILCEHSFVVKVEIASRNTGYLHATRN